MRYVKNVIIGSGVLGWALARELKDETTVVLVNNSSGPKAAQTGSAQGILHTGARYQLQDRSAGYKINRTYLNDWQDMPSEPVVALTLTDSKKLHAAALPYVRSGVRLLPTPDRRIEFDWADLWRKLPDTHQPIAVSTISGQKTGCGMLLTVTDVQQGVTHRIETQHVYAAAGLGNFSVGYGLGVYNLGAHIIRRPMTLYEVCGSVLSENGPVSNYLLSPDTGKLMVSVTNHKTLFGETLWQVGGPGVDDNFATAAARTPLEQFYRLDWNLLEIKTRSITRAQAARPIGEWCNPCVLRCGRVVMGFPDKLVAAIRCAKMMLEMGKVVDGEELQYVDAFSNSQKNADTSACLTACS